MALICAPSHVIVCRPGVLRSVALMIFMVVPVVVFRSRTGEESSPSVFVGNKFVIGSALRNIECYWLCLIIF